MKNDLSNMEINGEIKDKEIEKKGCHFLKKYSLHMQILNSYLNFLWIRYVAGKECQKIFHSILTRVKENVTLRNNAYKTKFCLTGCTKIHT